MPCWRQCRGWHIPWVNTQGLELLLAHRLEKNSNRGGGRSFDYKHRRSFHSFQFYFKGYFANNSLWPHISGKPQTKTNFLVVQIMMLKEYIILLSPNTPAPAALWPGLAGGGTLTHCSWGKFISQTAFPLCQTPWCTCHSSFPPPATNFNFLSPALKQSIITTNYRSLRDYQLTNPISTLLSGTTDWGLEGMRGTCAAEESCRCLSWVEQCCHCHLWAAVAPEGPCVQGPVTQNSANLHQVTVLTPKRFTSLQKLSLLHL